ncbi:transporter substrate-binding domain-containing protein [Rhodoplanes sp. SY1]|uniref:transporter substrate-binding domain-containing protein n=1 Tax=Rhodoplanes sp. SY1 TaxID=3166646 RepID=UPI0038B5ACE4
MMGLRLPRRATCTAFTILVFTTTAMAADLAEIKARGEIRHLGINYANFVTGDGDGFDVELIQGFARHIGVRYTLVLSDFYSVVRDLLGREAFPKGDGVELTGDYPIRGDLISAGFTKLPWRTAALLFSEPTFPSQVLLIAPADSPVRPIEPTGELSDDIQRTKTLIGHRSLLVMERTCLDPSNYGLKNMGIDLKVLTTSTNLNEMVPALLNGDADFALLDVPDALLDLRKWAGRFKVIGPISDEQTLATAFPPDAGLLREEFDRYLAALKANGGYEQLVKKYYPGIKRFFPRFFAAVN